jgi:iron(III) transport system permease protein
MLLPVAETMTRIPQSLNDSALNLGLSRGKAFWRALFPQLKFAVAAGAILVFLQSTNELTVSLLLQPIGYGSLPLRIFYYSVNQLTRDASIWVLCSVVVCIYPVWALSSFLDSGRGYHA